MSPYQVSVNHDLKKWKPHKKDYHFRYIYKAYINIYVYRKIRLKYTCKFKGLFLREFLEKGQTSFLGEATRAGLDCQRPKSDRSSQRNRPLSNYHEPDANVC